MRECALYVLAVTTGMRQGELLGLQWPDVDLAAATLSVRHTLTKSKDGTLERTQTKTNAGRRMIDLPPMAVGALREHHTRQVRRRASI